MPETQENPYRSSHIASQASDRTAPNTRAKTADTALVGLFYGGTIGTATGATMVVCVLGWAALTRVPDSAAWDPFGTAEAMIGRAVASILLGGCSGGIIGTAIGAFLGWLAAIGRPAIRRRLPEIATASSAVAALLLVIVLSYRSTGSEKHLASLPPLALIVLAAAVGAAGGYILGRTVTSLVAPTPSSVQRDATPRD